MFVSVIRTSSPRGWPNCATKCHSEERQCRRGRRRRREWRGEENVPVKDDFQVCFLYRDQNIGAEHHRSFLPLFKQVKMRRRISERNLTKKKHKKTLRNRDRINRWGREDFSVFSVKSPWRPPDHEHNWNHLIQNFPSVVMPEKHLGTVQWLSNGGSPPKSGPRSYPIWPELDSKINIQ